MNNGNDFTRGLLARARDEVARENPTFWSWKDDGPEFAGVFVEKDEAEYEGRKIPVRIYHRLDHGDYRGIWLWDSPQRLRELHDELDPQPGDFVYIHVHAKRPKRDKPGEFWTPVDMKVIPAAEVNGAAAEVDAADDYGPPTTAEVHEILDAVDAEVNEVADEVSPVAGDEYTERALFAERDERDGLVDDHGTPIRY